MTTTDYPTQPGELTTEWLTATLEAAGVLHGAKVIGLSTSPVGEGIGMLGILARVDMTFDGPVPDAPQTIIAKFPSAVPGNRVIGMTYRLYEREVNFYTRVTKEVEGLAAPRCYGGQYDPETGDSFLLLEDLGAYRTGDQVAGCTAAEAMTILDAVIPLHAKYWDRIDDPLMEGVTKVDDPYQIDGIAGGSAVGWDPCVQMFPEAMPEEIRAVKDRFLAAVPELHHMVGRLVQTIIHGDLRLDNTMFGDSPDLRPVVLLDWTLTKTSGLHDVAYLVSQNVDLEDRRAHEEAIIAHYHGGLVAHGVKDYSLEQCWSDYQLVVLHLFAYAVLIAGTLDPSNDRGAAFMRQMLHRSSSAVMDHKLLSLIPDPAE
jgi:Ecdysteroid kinase-like family